MSVARPCVGEERADRMGSSCPHPYRGLITGRSFNGRTRRSGRRYRGSNPCLPASSFGAGRSSRLRSHPNTPRSSTPSRPRLVGNESESLPPSQPPLACGELRLGRPLRGRRTEKRACSGGGCLDEALRRSAAEAEGEVGRLTSCHLQPSECTPQLRTRVSKAERIRPYSSESLSGIRRANTRPCVESERDSFTFCGAKPTRRDTTSVVQQTWMSGLIGITPGPPGTPFNIDPGV